jgi:hypothetical protein
MSFLAYPNARRWNWVWQSLDTARYIQLQAHKSKNPSANAGVSINSVVARGGIEPGAEDAWSLLKSLSR